ncbi:type II toxin-antitoxin system VapC family toxin [Mycoplana sp. MJR14]|uniref:type II toxin-antitoxin system VapC family toxin n=1 Tax=Mycoplana sp. MJR14 TaxID=3032583 RepID=UPI0023DB16F1|nr:type II toxin-antitoxin system VapC family toxin [Mycoplana sp. MJR14]MDF1634646.1 type II toxin-antitoxin system VapC family toxin [Mycoplana sp. MJR14]
MSVQCLLDTHILLSVLRSDLEQRFPPVARLLLAEGITAFSSVASLWEIAIKTRLGKLDPGMELKDIAGFLVASGFRILPVDVLHVVEVAEPAPATNDPFDRLLLAQCHVEGLQLVTADRMLVDHPLSWKP